MINPGSVAGQMPPGDDALIRRIQDLERAMKELSAQDVLRTAGLIAAPNKLTVQGELDVTGPMVVGGTLTLPAGIIGNTSLTNPVSVGLASNRQTNFAVPTATGAFATATLTVPAGFTSAIIWSWAGASLYNSTASAMYAYLESGPAGSGAGMPWPVSGTTFVTMSQNGVISRTGLTAGATISISALITADYAIPASTFNQANTRVMALWFR